MPKTVPCPNCERPVVWSDRNPHRPFCSERCRMSDLGGWFDGTNHIPGPELPEELLVDPESDDTRHDS